MLAPGRNGWLVVGVLLIAANLRAPITVVGPLLSSVDANLQLTAVTASLLVSVPVLCFAAFSPVAPAVAKAFGLERTLGLALAGLAVGIGCRSLVTGAGLWIGTGLIGASIATMNVLLPALVKHGFPQTAGRVTGLYSTAQSIAAAAATGLAVSIAGTSPEGWRTAFGIWAGLAIIALAVFTPQLHQPHLGASSPQPRPGEGSSASHRPPWTTTTAWQITIFMGTQSMLFYTLVSWWPSIQQAGGVSAAQAGLNATVMQVAGIIGGLAVTAFLSARTDLRIILLGLVLLSTAAMVGELTKPGGALAWSILFGLGGGTIVLALALFSLRSADAAEAAALSGMAQSIGYLLAAGGPVLVGAIWEITGSWTGPLLLLLALQVIQLSAGLLATSPPSTQARRQVGR